MVSIAAHSRIESRAPFALRASKPGVRDEEGSKDSRHRTGWCPGSKQRCESTALLRTEAKTGGCDHHFIQREQHGLLRADHRVSGPWARSAGVQGLSTSFARRRAPLGAHGRLLEHDNLFCRFQRSRCIESQLAIRSPQKHHQGAHAHHSCSRLSEEKFSGTN